MSHSYGIGLGNGRALVVGIIEQDKARKKRPGRDNVTLRIYSAGTWKLGGQRS